jgi:hypothetical protein
VNNFPRLPVREGEWVLVWFVGLADRAAFDRARRAGNSAAGPAERFAGLREPPRVLWLGPDGTLPAERPVTSVPGDVVDHGEGP